MQLISYTSIAFVVFLTVSLTFMYFYLLKIIIANSSNRLEKDQSLASNSDDKITVSLKKSNIYEICKYINKISGIAIGERQKSQIARLVPERLKALGVKNYKEYMLLLNNKKTNELDHLIDAFSTNFTYFFREKDQINYIVKNLKSISEKLARQGRNELKIWSSACSKGHEVYTVMIQLNEEIERLGLDLKLKIFGSDISGGAIKIARRAIYDKKEINKIPAELVSKYFNKGKGASAGLYKLKAKYHNIFKFSKINLMDEEYDVPQVDIIFVRNVLIYFTEKKWQEVVGRLQKYLSEEGLLITGTAEILDSGLITNFIKKGPSVYALKQNVFSSKFKQSKNNSIINIQPQNVSTLFLDKSAEQVKMALKNSNTYSFASEYNSVSDLQKSYDEYGKQIVIVDIDKCKNPLSLVSELIFKVGSEIVLLTAKDINTNPAMFEILSLGVKTFLKKDKQGIIHKNSIERSLNDYKTKEFLAGEPKKLNTDVPIFIGASTGGIKALTNIFERLPQEIPPIVVVQHIPGKYSKDFADRLNKQLPYSVNEAKEGQELLKNQILIAPSGTHIGVKHLNNKTIISYIDDEPVYGFKPAVDKMFFSVAKDFKGSGIGLILTGMGKDGAEGMLAMKKAGFSTIAQGEDSSAVYGMPKAAVSLGGVDSIVDLKKIPDVLAITGNSMVKKIKKAC